MATLDLTPSMHQAIDRDWVRLARPGTWLDAEQRVRVAAVARGAAEPTTAAERAARRIHDAPASITRGWIAELEHDGMSPTQYVEVLGIVSRLRAIDTLTFGSGRLPRPLPEPLAGSPSRIAVDDARIDGGWVPTVGAAFPTTVLSSVPAENEAMNDLHTDLYLAGTAEPEGNSMGNLHVVRDGLDRAQMEFVAARTSLLNDCFF